MFHHNIRTDELQEITATRHDLNRIIKMLICKRLHQEQGFSDEEFVYNCTQLADVQPCEICILAHV